MPRKGKAAALITLALGLLALWEGRVGVEAADSDPTTWGATDPTWSPDGKQLAFSLFGSIWQAPVEGGAAVQVTTGEGYHAHPAWSPDGRRIAFIRGQLPAGRLPLVSGPLMVVDSPGGAEREVKTPFPAAGTPAWSPDSRLVVCALRVPNFGAVLHEIDVDGGATRRIQGVPQRGGVSAWSAASWSRMADEVYFVGSRGGPEQVWSLKPGVEMPGIQVQLPLTRYLPGDIALLEGVSALPDGTGVVYSADVVNGRGNYELYRVGRDSGQAVAVTNTERDEFAPAVSPDGKWIAHVSNQLGNIDLFVMPASGGEKRHVTIKELKFRWPAGKVRIRVLDEQGRATPARLYVRAADGKGYAPRGTQVFYYMLEPQAPKEPLFVGTGDDVVQAPAGRMRIVAVKGIEYEPLERHVEIAAGDQVELTLQLRRWTNWMQRGWYTGENHYHANYNGSYYQRPPDSMRWLEAQDLNTANMIVANSEGAFIHDKEFFTGKVHPLSTGRYILYWGQEYRNSYPLGHMAFLNIKQQVPPSYTSVIGSDSAYDFPLNTMAAQKARAQGGMVSYVHPQAGSSGDVFDSMLGAKEMPVGAALDSVDSIDVLPFGVTSYELWYRHLNAGFRISAGAGTDCFTNWRGINRLPGEARSYVEVGGNLAWDRWIERHREGRNFVTTGPLVAFNVNGEPAGAVIRTSAGQPYRARLAAEVSWREELDRVEFVEDGKVIESRSAEAGAKVVRIEKEVAVGRSTWFAVRAFAKQVKLGSLPGGVPMAHSSPVYVHVGGKPVLIKQDLELMVRWVDRLWLLLEERDNLGPGDNRERARKMIEQARAHFVRKLAEGN